MLQIKTLAINVALRTGLLGVIVLCGMAFSYAIDIPYHDAILIFESSNYFWFDGRHIAYLSLAPFLAYTIIMLSFTIISRENKVPKKFNIPGSILSIISIASLITLNAISLFVYFYIFFFTPYKPCHEPNLSNYFVKDLNMCQRTILSQPSK